MNVVNALPRPTGRIDMVLDTDTYNEIDDQFAISYVLRSPELVDLKALYAAPFHNIHSDGPEDGMERSYDEILRILKLAGHDELNNRVFKGSRAYLESETVPQLSDAASDLIERAMNYTSDQPLYVVAIGAITNIASALLLRPEIRDRVVIVWLGGHALHWEDTHEFNMYQDVAAARVVFTSGVRLVQVPCMGVIDVFTTTRYELEHWLVDKNPLADYLARNTIREAEDYAAGKPWSRVLWDVVAVAWVLDRDRCMVEDRYIPAPLPEYDNYYGVNPLANPISYVYKVNRDALMEDLFKKLLSNP